MPLDLVTAPSPADEPVTLETAKLHLRVDGTDEDVYITDQIIAAREYVEGETGRALPPQTWAVTLHGWPPAHFLLPKPPLVEVTSIRYLDADGVWQTWAASNYTTTAPKGPACRHGEVQLAYGVSYPTLRGVPNQVVMTFTCGYSATNPVPRDLVEAMLLHLGLHYRFRGDPMLGALTGAEHTELAITRKLRKYVARDPRVVVA